MTIRLSNAIRAGVAFVLLAGAMPAVAASGLQPPYSRGYDPARDPFIDGRDALALARQTNRRVLIELGGDWCRWCQALEHFLTRDTRLNEQLHRDFVVLKVNVSEENDNAEFLAGLPPNLGYPHIYVSDADGRIIHSQDTADFLRNGRYDEQRILAFLERWRAPRATGGERP